MDNSRTNTLCAFCDGEMRPDQHAVRCKTCNDHQHRRCHTGVSAEAYLTAMKNNTDIDWNCMSCHMFGTPERIEVPITSQPTQVFPRPGITFDVGEAYPYVQSGPVDIEPRHDEAHDMAQLANEFREAYSAINPAVQSGPEGAECNIYMNPPRDESSASSPPRLQPISPFQPNQQSHQLDISSPQSTTDTSSSNFVEYEIPISHEEPTITDIPPRDLGQDNDEDISFSLINSSSQRGMSKLADSDGYSYTKKYSGKYKTTWRCSIQNSKLKCPAVVRQEGENFTLVGRHVHPPTLDPANRLLIRSDIKAKATDNVFQSASSIVDTVLLNRVDPSAPITLIKPASLARMANRKRKGMRPDDPSDLEFELDMDFLPDDFLCDDVKVGARRHLIFATKRQLDVLNGAKRWYIDATFRVVRKPFNQLLSIHAFISNGDSMKQVPLAFALMSGKRKQDYVAVFQSILGMLESPQVLECMVDYEEAVWRAINYVFPFPNIKGCVFHWAQAVYRKVQEIGLAYAYKHDIGTTQYIKKILSLPYLPAEFIPNEFEKIEADANTAKLQDLVSYVRNTWIDNRLWKPSTWSCFMSSIRTNNDVEGWHRRLNQRARNAGVALYVLIPLLHHEAGLLPLQMRLVSEQKLARYQRSAYRDLQKRLFQHWEQFNEDDLSPTQLLRRCAHIVPNPAPAPSRLQRA